MTACLPHTADYSFFFFGFASARAEPSAVFFGFASAGAEPSAVFFGFGAFFSGFASIGAAGASCTGAGRFFGGAGSFGAAGGRCIHSVRATWSFILCNVRRLRCSAARAFSPLIRDTKILLCPAESITYNLLTFEFRVSSLEFRVGVRRGGLNSFSRLETRDA